MIFEKAIRNILVISFMSLYFSCGRHDILDEPREGYTSLDSKGVFAWALTSDRVKDMNRSPR